MILITFLFLLQQNFISDTIRIGLLIQDKQSLAAKQGAELAIKEANRNARPGKYYKLEVRDMEGPWGTGAKESVSLVFDKDVWAVIGSVDGRNSHLAEQVSAKTRVPFLSAWSGDPTLGQAFIPWFFSLVPNDEQTASLLLSEIQKAGNVKILLLHQDGYDSKMAASAFMKKASPEKKKTIEIIRYSKGENELPAIVEKASGRYVVFFGPAKDLALLTNKPGNAAGIYSPLLLMDEGFKQTGNFSDVYVFDPVNSQGEKYVSFSRIFKKEYGIQPGPVSAYSYDAVNLIIEGVSQSGKDQVLLFRKIAGLKFNGVTGEITFDEHGNRKAMPRLVRYRDCSFIKN